MPAYKWLRYIIINTIFASSIYFGFFCGINGAANLALFMGWITGILGCITLLAIGIDNSESGKGEFIELMSRQDPPVVPFWFDLIFDIAVTAAFIWSGHYILAIFYIISIYAGKAIRDIPKDLMLKKLKSQQS